MKYKKGLFKKLREEELGLSREDFCSEINKRSDGKFVLRAARLERLENKGLSRINADDMCYIYELLGKNPNYFYDELIKEEEE